MNLAFGATKTLIGISIYNGYNNRDDGSYLLNDGAGNVLGGWSIATPSTGITAGTNDGTNSFWLTFNTPVTTDHLVFDTTSTDAFSTDGRSSF